VGSVRGGSAWLYRSRRLPSIDTRFHTARASSPWRMSTFRSWQPYKTWFSAVDSHLDATQTGSTDTSCLLFAPAAGEAGWVGDYNVSDQRTQTMIRFTGPVQLLAPKNSIPNLPRGGRPTEAAVLKPPVQRPAQRQERHRTTHGHHDSHRDTRGIASRSGKSRLAASPTAAAALSRPRSSAHPHNCRHLLPRPASPLDRRHAGADPLHGRPLRRLRADHRGPPVRHYQGAH